MCRQSCLVIAAYLVAMGMSMPTAKANDFVSGTSAKSAATGGAFTPSESTASDAMTINPAALSFIKRPTVEGTIGGFFARGEFSNAANRNSPLRANGLVPTGAFATPLGRSRFSLGFNVAPYIASAAKWNYVDAPGGAGQVSYGPMRHNSEIVSFRSAAGIAYKFGSFLQVGGTFGAILNRNTLQTAYIFQQHPALAGLKTTLDLKTSGTAYNASAGFLLRPAKQVLIGAAWTGQATVASSGRATGNIGVQLAAIGLGAARPDFRYDAQVDCVHPQSVTVHGLWQASRQWKLLGQVDWINWQRSFNVLPVQLTNGNNADINGVLTSNGINDAVPLNWNNETVTRFGVERSWLENAVVRAGYAYSNQIVPDSTLSPLTASITRHAWSTGLGWSFGRLRLDGAYSLHPGATRTSGQSILKGGEYSNSRVRVGTQGILLTTSIQL